MRRIGLVAVALVLGLTACAHDMPRHTMAACKPDWKNPNVDIREGKYIVVDQDPVVVPKGAKDKITWQLDPKSGYTFPDDGIVIDKGGAEFDCKLQQGGARIACDNRHSAPGRYKYTIKVRDPNGNLLDQLDPYVVND